MAFKIEDSTAEWHDSDVRIEVNITTRDVRIAWHRFADKATLEGAQIAMAERWRWSPVPISASGLECMALIVRGYAGVGERGGG